MRKIKGGLAINALLNTIKQCCIIVFPMITFPYISRVLGANNYGKINFSQSIVSYLSIVASLGIGQYAIREGAKARDNTKELYHTVNELFTINFFSSTISTLFFLLLVFFLPALLDYRVLLLVQGCIVIFNMLGAEWINSVFEDYYILTLRYIVFHIIAIVCMFVFVRKREDYIVYAGITSLASIIPNCLNIFYIRKRYNIHIRLVHPKKTKKHILSIFLLFASSIASIIYISSDTTILGIIKGDYNVGLYSVSAKIYSLVKQLINALLFVAIPKFSNSIATGKKQIVEKQINILLAFLVSIIIPLVVGMITLSENIVMLVSGEEYLLASKSLQILSIAILFATLACFFINLILLPLGKEKIILKGTVISAFVNIILNIILIPSYGEVAAAFTTVLSEIIMFIWGITYSKHDYKFKIGKGLLCGLISGACTLIIIQIIKYFGLNELVELLLCVTISILVYLVIMAVSNKNVYKELIMILKK